MGSHNYMGQKKRYVQYRSHEKPPKNFQNLHKRSENDKKSSCSNGSTSIQSNVTSEWQVKTKHFRGPRSHNSSGFFSPQIPSSPVKKTIQEQETVDLVSLIFNDLLTE